MGGLPIICIADSGYLAGVTIKLNEDGNMTTQHDTLKAKLQQQTPLLWLNPNYQRPTNTEVPVTLAAIRSAENDLARYAPLLEALFPELTNSAGIIESKLLALPAFNQQHWQANASTGALYIKADHALPIAGSIKARGGIYEVLVIAEQLAIKQQLISAGDTPLALLSDAAKTLFADHTISVGSTGNLGLSIGVMTAALGFNAVVHMSADAKPWKKQRLTDRGVTVVEHQGDYASAVAAGREQALSNPQSHFIDDEHSLPLFLGYSVAALRLKAQLAEQHITVDKQHPLFIYIPCGVGGAPGGITFGLKQLFGDHVHCFFAEPTDAPCMLVQLALSDNDQSSTSVYDIGLKNKTDADGLAVASASLLVASMMRPLVSGIYTLPDNDLYRWLYRLKDAEGISVEPSSAAGFAGPQWLLSSAAGKHYLDQQGITDAMPNSTHIVWTTGGRFVPANEYDEFYKLGQKMCDLQTRVKNNQDM